MELEAITGEASTHVLQDAVDLILKEDVKGDDTRIILMRTSGEELASCRQRDTCCVCLAIGGRRSMADGIWYDVFQRPILRLVRDRKYCFFTSNDSVLVFAPPGARVARVTKSTSWLGHQDNRIIDAYGSLLFTYRTDRWLFQTTTTTFLDASSQAVVATLKHSHDEIRITFASGIGDRVDQKAAVVAAAVLLFRS